MAHDEASRLASKRERLRRLLEKGSSPSINHDDRASASEDRSLDMFAYANDAELTEVGRFYEWFESVAEQGAYPFEAARDGAQCSQVAIERVRGGRLNLLNFSSYNYLGLGYHPEVIQAAQEAVARYGLGACSSPVISGTYSIHREFELRLLEFFGLPYREVSLFSSGYGANVGTIQALMKPGGHILLDAEAHASIADGARASGAAVTTFRHNDMGDLRTHLQRVCDGRTRVLVCTEGLFSAGGDFGELTDLVSAAHEFGALTLVDEAHSVLLAGPQGRGVSEDQGVLDKVDLYVMTLSKAFGGVGGALLARREIARYVNWFARCRFFSCALDPAVTGGMAKSLELASGPLGAERRIRLLSNARRLRENLDDSLDLCRCDGWIVPVVYGDDRITLELYDWLQRNGLDASLMQYPAVPKGEARIRIFVTSEHSDDEIDRASEIVLRAACKFRFPRHHR